MWLSHGVAAVLIFFPMFITHVLYLRDFKFSENKAQVVAWHTGSPVSIALGIAWFTVWTEMGHKGQYSVVLCCSVNLKCFFFFARGNGPIAEWSLVVALHSSDVPSVPGSRTDYIWLFLPAKHNPLSAVVQFGKCMIDPSIALLISVCNFRCTKPWLTC